MNANGKARPYIIGRSLVFIPNDCHVLSCMGSENRTEFRDNLFAKPPSKNGKMGPILLGSLQKFM